MKAHSPSFSTSPLPQNSTSPQPNPPKQHAHSEEKPHPYLPPHTRPFSHAQHSVHGPSEPDARVVEGVVHRFGEGGGCADFGADCYCDLFRGERVRDCFLAREGDEWREEERKKGGQTSFNILTLALMPSSSESFWDSSSERTASLYWPLQCRCKNISVQALLSVPTRVLPGMAGYIRAKGVAYLEFGVAGLNPPFIPPPPLMPPSPLPLAPIPYPAARPGEWLLVRVRSPV